MQEPPEQNHHPNKQQPQRLVAQKNPLLRLTTFLGGNLLPMRNEIRISHGVRMIIAHRKIFLFPPLLRDFLLLHPLRSRGNLYNKIMSHEGIRFLSEEDRAHEATDQKLSRDAVTPAKVRVLVSEGKGLEIDWKDGHKSVWSFAWLRNACPCAGCNSERQQSGRKPGQPKVTALLPIYAPPPIPASAHAVGRYALGFRWADGHDDGIYTWEYLRSVCQCPQCASRNDVSPAETPLQQ